ncbi:MAG: gamma-glutamylcyclotransferase [Proteobacteria bacterium]|nr:gamma-glutamylcyclotransferase [Pseudomonadota bacterium]
MPLIFVYGTLRKGGNHHHLLGKDKFICSVRSRESFAVHHVTTQEEPEGYPVAVPSPAGETLEGEIYEISDETLRTLDEYEDYPRLYDRRTFEFTQDNGSIISALMYCGHPEKP